MYIQLKYVARVKLYDKTIAAFHMTSQTFKIKNY